ncbi:MAG: family transporter [Gammaproteobacteria bacterium]|jgi:putative permease|nr:family transporter [Gammaproteobacteria bacterium]
MMRSISGWFQRRFVGTELGGLALLIVFVILIFWLLGKLLAPVFVSIVFAYLLQGMVSRLEKWKFSHALAVNLVFVVFFSLLVLASFILLPLLWEQLSALINDLPQKIKKLEVFVISISQEYPTYISREQVQRWIAVFQSDFSRLGNFVLSFSLSTISGTMMLVVYLVLVPLMVYFFVKDRDEILRWFSAFLPQKRQLIKHVWGEVNDQIANYIRAKILEIIIVWVAATAAFLIFGLNYAILLGVIVSLSVLVPYVGVVIVTIPVLIVGYLQWGFDIHFAYLSIVYFIIMVLDGNVLAPLLFSGTMKIHPLAVIIAILIFGALWGFWGVFFAVPLASVAKALLNVWIEDNKAHLVDFDRKVIGKKER